LEVRPRRGTMQARSIKPEPELPAAGATRRQRVLFVDDESSILEGLRAVLRPQRREWDMVFALGGPAGKQEVESSKFDVVVTDMRMPIVDGAALLTRVKELQPHAVRLVLSGQTDPQTAMKSVFTAHQFLAKPCDVEKLRSVVKRCCELNELLAAEELKSLAGDVSLLPAAPSTYLSISRVVADPGSGIQDVARIIEGEPTLCAKLLQVTNSAFFGLPHTVTSISQAATYLGSLALRDLALAMETLSSAQRRGSALPPASHRAFQLNAVAVALLGRRWYVSDKRKADDAFIAGMLRDMGHLVLAAHARRCPEDVAQHAALSAYLLGLWGIPHAVLEAVAYHEEPSRLEHETLELVDVVHVCDALVGEVAPSPFQAPPLLDETRLATLGVSPTRLSELRVQAMDVLREAREILGS
jgi:HD-like signal output (HDOD) protein